MLNSTHTYTAVLDRQGDLAQHKDGRPVYCPKQNPIPTQGAMGQVSFTRLGCTTGCPSCNIVTDGEDDEKLFFNITCEGQNLLLPLEPVEEKPKSALFAV